LFVLNSLIPNFSGMAEALRIKTHIDKRAEIIARITAYFAYVAPARDYFAHVEASIRLFSEPDRHRATYMVSHGFFNKGDIADICVRHPGSDGVFAARHHSNAFQMDLASEVLSVTPVPARRPVLLTLLAMKMVTKATSMPRRTFRGVASIRRSVQSPSMGV
jgi:hypothetical protein